MNAICDISRVAVLDQKEKKIEVTKKSSETEVNGI